MIPESLDLERAASEQEPLVKLLAAICQTPAPTFLETRRAELVARVLRDAGLEPHNDGVGNIVADLPGGQGPRLLLAAHLDTVFPEGTDVRIRRSGGRLMAPGIGDNSASLAVMLHLAQQVAEGAGSTPRPRLALAATVGEEGLGDLRGMRELVRARRRDFDAVIALDGHLGTIVAEAVGSKRFEITFTAHGGHSWGDYPSPSAVHALGDAIHLINGMTVPRQPRSAYNVGIVQGGTSVNAIAQQAVMKIDLRSVDQGVLQRMTQDAENCVRKAALRHRVEFALAQVGDRPAARVPNAALVSAGRQVLEELGLQVRITASSTDANAAMAVGLPAIAFGVYHGGDAHRESEWLEISSLVTGYTALRRLLARLATMQPSELQDSAWPAAKPAP